MLSDSEFKKIQKCSSSPNLIIVFIVSSWYCLGLSLGHCFCCLFLCPLKGYQQFMRAASPARKFNKITSVIEENIFKTSKLYTFTLRVNKHSSHIFELVLNLEKTRADPTEKNSHNHFCNGREYYQNFEALYYYVKSF